MGNVKEFGGFLSEDQAKSVYVSVKKFQEYGAHVIRQEVCFTGLVVLVEVDGALFRITNKANPSQKEAYASVDAFGKYYGVAE